MRGFPAFCLTPASDVSKLSCKDLRIFSFDQLDINDIIRISKLGTLVRWAVTIATLLPRWILVDSFKKSRSHVKVFRNNLFIFDLYVFFSCDATEILLKLTLVTNIASYSSFLRSFSPACFHIM